MNILLMNKIKENLESKPYKKTQNTKQDETQGEKLDIQKERGCKK